MGLSTLNKDRDSQFVREALEGNQKAFSEIMRLYWKNIEMMLSKKINNKEDVEDIAIATFSKAFDKLDTYSDEYAFSTWLNTIAQNTLVDYFRKKEQVTISIDEEKEGLDGEPISLEIPDQQLGPEEDLIKRQKNKHILSLVHRLKPHYRELIILRYLEELSYMEIAEKLDMPLGSVKAKLFRARDLLFQILKPDENEY